MRPADDCKPDCQRRVPVRPVPTASRRGISPTGLDAPRGSRRRGTLWFAAAGSPDACSAPGLPSRLASDASSPVQCELKRVGCTPHQPRPLSPSPREGRRLLRPEASSSDERAQMNPRTTLRPRGRSIVPGVPSPECPTRVPSLTVRPCSAATEHVCIDRSATCQNLQAARSTSTTCQCPNLARGHAFSAQKRRSIQGAASRKTPEKPGWRLEGACLAGRRTSSQHALVWRLGPLKPAERSRVAARVRAGVGDTPTLVELAKARFEPPRANESTLHEP